ncbi:MAG: hypothetical protein CO118_07950 [Flavobacteriales bacterium CG_4_9_14_3_um_filter_32_8]|nr:MAG: hypothetical protein CO118_07950 [Flavobacteriales bacterium CG_4_9_14_3_um_filter_32_8]
MKLIKTIKNNKTVFIDFLFICIVFIFSFPNFNPDFNTGLDAPFRWAYNYLFINDYETLLNINYAYGPLAFLKVPVVLGNNFLIALLFFSFTKFLFLYLLLLIGKVRLEIFGYLLVLVLSYFLKVDSIIIGLTIIFCINYLNKKNLVHYSLAVLFSFVGLYIKPYIGINCLSVLFMLWIVLIVQKTLYKRILLLATITILLTIVITIIISGNLFYVFEYLSVAFHLSSGYSSSLALFPDNNWLWLSIFILSVISIPFFINKKDWKYFLILFPVFFFSWKYGMVREEFNYYTQMIETIILLWGFLILTSSFNKKRYYLIPVVSITALFFNLTLMNTNNNKFKIDLFGVKNFKTIVLSYDSFVKSVHQISIDNVKINHLPVDIREEIGNNSIDIYPWDFSYIVANNLNWQPRKTFQSIGICGWSDQRGCNSFSHEKGPEFILFHSKKDTSGGYLGSIDYRFLLNVEPLTNIQLFNNYDIYKINEKFTLFKKNSTPNYKLPIFDSTQIITWDTWYKCPKNSNGLSKVKVYIHKNIYGRILQFLYKDYEYYIDYKLTNSTVLTYRFIPSIAENGIWVNPMIRNFNSGLQNEVVSEIRFRASSSIGIIDDISIQWVEIEKKKVIYR